jgi:hypothetical protein
MKLPIWTVDDSTIVIVQKNYARQEQITCYAGRTRCTNLMSDWARFGEDSYRSPKDLGFVPWQPILVGNG